MAVMEAKLTNGLEFRKLLLALQELVSYVTLRWSPKTGLSAQEMDSSHVALMSLWMPPAAFERWEIRRDVALSLSVEAFVKRLRCGANNRSVTFVVPERAPPASKSLGLLLEDAHGGVGKYEVTLMEHDSELLGIPDVPYDATVTMPSAEYQRTVRELKEFADTVAIRVLPDAVRFELSDGAIISGGISLKGRSSTAPPSTAAPMPNRPNDDAAAAMAAPDGKSHESKSKQRPPLPRRPNLPQPPAHDRKNDPKSPPVGSDEDKELRAIPDAGDDMADGVVIALRGGMPSCELKFALRYLDKFARVAPVSGIVRLHLSRDKPLLVEYPLPANGRIRFYLAPKLEDNEPLPKTVPPKPP